MHPPHEVDEALSYRFCPPCGGQLEERVIKAGDPPRKVCVRCGFVFYIDPKVAVGTICRLDGRVVLVQRAIEPGYGKWVYPGGYVDSGETVEAAARREAREEANVEVRLDRLLNVYSYTGRRVIVIVYVGTVVGGEPAARDESLALRLVAPPQIPWEELAFPSTRQALQDFVALAP